MKKMKWSFGTLVSSWFELTSDLMVLAGSIMMAVFIASYIEVLATDTFSWWNMFNVFVR